LLAGSGYTNNVLGANLPVEPRRLRRGPTSD
jgi:hypothetical protein